MRETKLVKLFKGLSGNDLRQIRKMLASPFFTTNNNLISLFKLLRACHPGMDSNKLDKQLVFKKVFPGFDYSDIKLRNLNSEMVHIIEDYLVYKALHENDFERKKKLTEIYKHSGQSDLFKKEFKKAIESLNKDPFRDHHYFQRLHDLKLMQLEYIEGRDLEKRYDWHEEWEYALENYYQLLKIRQKIAFKSLQKIIKAPESKVNQFDKVENLLFKLYQKFDELYDTEDIKLFESVKALFQKNIALIRPNLRMELLSLLTNFAIKLMDLDDEKYNKEVLGLYKFGLDHRIIFNGTRITDAIYFNIAVSGSKAHEFEWTLNFIKTYEEFLSGSSKEDIKIISLSSYYFHKTEFSKAIDLINAHVFHHDQLKHVARMHSTRCYYELFLKDQSYFEALMAQILSNERYDRRNEMLTDSKFETQMNFFSFLKKLSVLRISGKLNAAQQSDMLELLSSYQKVTSRSWLKRVVSR